MTIEELKKITFIDLAFIEKDKNRAIILICRNEQAADKLHIFLKSSAFVLKHRIEDTGYYTVAINSKASTTGLMYALEKTKEQYPPLGWLDNNSVTHVLTAYYDKTRTLQRIEPALPLDPSFHLN